MSEQSLEELKKLGRLHIVNPDSLKTFADYAYWLEAILNNPCSIYEDGGELILIELKHLVARVGGLRIVVHPNEHPPPHFHVESNNINASFEIESCKLIKGRISQADNKKIQYWHKKAKYLLIEAWDLTRPTDCSVGKYK